MGTKFSEQNSKKVVAVFISCFFREDAVNNIRMISGILPQNGYKPVFFSTLDDLYYNDMETEGERHIFEVIDVASFDAIILFSETFKRDEDMINLIKKANLANVPIITIDRYLPGSNANICFNYATIFDDLCDHMLTCHDYKNIFFMAGPKNNPFSEERISVFFESCRKNNYKFDMKHLYYGDFWSEPCESCMRDIFRKFKKGQDCLPDCIICANDYMAFAVIQYLNNHGYRVPEDIAVSGFDGVPIEEYCTPRLTTAHTNHHDFLRKLVLTLDTLSETPKSQLGNITISNTLQIGCSCGCQSNIVGKSYGFDYVNLKNITNSRLQYEHDVSQLGIGSAEKTYVQESLKLLPSLVGRCNILDFYLVANKDAIENTFQGFTTTGPTSLADGTCFTSKMCAFNVVPFSENGVDKNYDLINYGDICPNFLEKLDYKTFLLCLPIHSDDKCLGYTVAEFDAKFFLYDFYSSFMMNMVHMITNQNHHIQLLRYYMSDSLTGLYNRNGFYNKFSELQSDYGRRTSLSIISMDMDGLKKINDSYGHAEGDNALCELAQFIKNSDGYQLAARVGGDEFIIALFGDDSEEVTKQIINNIKLQISYRNSKAENIYPIHASIAYYTAPIRDHSLDYFLKNADRLMYQTKKTHREKNYR